MPPEEGDDAAPELPWVERRPIARLAAFGDKTDKPVITAKALREQKAVMAGNLRAIDLSGDTAGEIYDQLSYYGSRSVPRLARDLNHPSPLVLRYLRAFQRAGR